MFAKIKKKKTNEAYLHIKFDSFTSFKPLDPKYKDQSALLFHVYKIVIRFE